MSTDEAPRLVAAKASVAAAIEAVPLIDHHVHGTLMTNPDRRELESMLSESDRPVPSWMSLFDSQIGLAIRRWCAPLLDLEPGVSPDDYVARRRELGPDEVSSRMLRHSGVEAYLIDTGLASPDISDVATVASMSGAAAFEIVRLESVFEDFLESIPDAREAVRSFPDVLRRRIRGAVGLKSVVAYRFGLDFDPERPSESEVVAAVRTILTQRGNASRIRVADPVVLRHLLWCGVDTGLPLQLHTGFGDPDLELHRCDPLLLTRFLKMVEARGTNITLLHCYPYHRQAGFLAESFPGVYFDMGLGVNFTGLRSDALIAESLELAPFAKVLFSSDAWGPAELHYLGARLWRRGMTNLFAPWLAADEIDLTDIVRITRLIGNANSRRLYGLDEHLDSRRSNV